MAEILRLAEENGHRLRTLDSDLTQFRTEQGQRIGALEQRINDAAAAAAAGVPVTTNSGPVVNLPPTTRPAPTRPPASAGRPDTTAVSPSTATAGGPAGDPGEDAYTEGFKLWEAGQYDDAITALRAFTSAYPKHRRISYANNLIGRALLDKGQARAAAEALLSNYRSNPKGERAPDSLFYLGQALMQLGQPGQACNAYSELEAVYGAKMRADLKKQLADAKVQAQCS